MSSVFTKLDQFKDISPESGWYPYFSKSFSLHHLIDKLLQVTGPAHLCLSSYTLADEALSLLMHLSSSGTIMKIDMLIDSSNIWTKQRQTRFACMITNARIYHTINHSKIILIRNKTWNISLVTSANLTSNARYESGALCTDSGMMELYLSTLTSIMENNAVRVNFNDSANG